MHTYQTYQGLRDFLNKYLKKGGDGEAGTVNVEQGKKQRSQRLRAM